jgi:hypothetical protein
LYRANPQANAVGVAKFELGSTWRLLRGQPELRGHGIDIVNAQLDQGVRAGNALVLR